MQTPQGVLARVRMLGNIHRWDGGPVDRVLARLRLPADRWFLRRVGRFDELREIVGPAPKPHGPRVLMIALRGMPDHNVREAVVIEALRRRGVHVGLLTCGGGMPLCEAGWSRQAYPRPCDRCAWTTQQVADILDVPHYRLADLFPWGGDGRSAPLTEDADAIPGASAGEAAAISLAWLTRTSDLSLAPEAEEFARDLQVSAAGVARAVEEVFDDFRPDVVVTLNGLFAAESTIRYVAAARGIRVTTYEFAPRANAVIFSNGTPAPEYDVDSMWADAADRPLDGPQRAAIEGLLADRRRQVGHVRYFKDVEDDAEALRETLSIPPDGRVIALFTNISWDSATLFKDVAYPSIQDWLEHVVRVAGTLENRYLVVRVHPGEDQWRTRERLGDLLLERFGGVLPANVRLVGPGEPLSTYTLLDISELVLGYTTTVGLEAACSGTPVAVAGKTHYRGRGFTIDIESPEDLERLLTGEPPTMTGAETELALRYAFGFFFRFQMPFPLVETVDGRVVRLPSAEQLAPAAEPYLDHICERIVDGGDFLLPLSMAV